MCVAEPFCKSSIYIANSFLPDMHTFSHKTLLGQKNFYSFGIFSSVLQILLLACKDLCVETRDVNVEYTLAYNTVPNLNYNRYSPAEVSTTFKHNSRF